ncbi:zinc ribbon domain-containing protein [Pseudogemmatithrix spongiicola]|uniref:Zinc ribbon domain-containing protein n=1 Tax=Pseudogemmatithrix spongiicola TaxID=3062599 RepID=A0AA49Q3H5_9BACT|nr:zinc ribbon domain-containing protein [Gemmatimonadaceae bacterium 'strain 138']WKW13767.1 zinc ribbon domain-containing protein [Gemmatimonadaceae bacterium 'strain 318']
MAKHCAHCGAALGERGKFCHRCGAPREGGAADTATGAGAAGAARPAALLPWAIAGISVLALVAFIAGQKFGGSGSAAATAAPPAAATGSRAVDITSMSPQERADRLFDRVMRLASRGEGDSVQFFAPMAIQAFEALQPLDAHGRYDLGLLGVFTGDGSLAAAQSDTILAAQPTHLLGLILGMRAAGLRTDTAAFADYAGRLRRALASERAKGLQEYVDHAVDIDAAVREADGMAPVRSQ